MYINHIKFQYLPWMKLTSIMKTNYYLII